MSTDIVATVVVYVSGGNVQSVSTDWANPERVRVIVVDYDNAHDYETADKDAGVHQFDDGLAAVGAQDVLSDPEGVAAILAMLDS